MALEFVRQCPQNFGLDRSRWTLHLLQSHCTALTALQTLSGVWRRLRAWRVRLRQGRLHLHSPDPDYGQKVEIVRACLADHSAVALYGDELTIYRQPSPGRAYAVKGKGSEYRAALGWRCNTKRRLCGALNARTGQVHWLGRAKAGVRVLCLWLAQLRQAYPDALHLVLVWDNWPVHKHPKVLAAAQAAGIELVWLPTYAPWLNPIEKLWRKLKQDVLCLHRFGDDWTAVQEKVTRFLDGYARPAPDLLRYVGLMNKPLSD